MAGFDYSKTDNFYVYIHKCPITNEIRYVGKGRNKRAYKLTDRLSKHKNWIDSLARKNLKPIVEIYKDNLTDLEALRLEESLISEYRKLNINLNNIHSKGGVYTSKKDNKAWNKGKFGIESMHYGKKRSDLTKRNQSEAQHKKVLEKKGGAYFFKPMQKWHSRITILGKRKHIGYFNTKEEAILAYEKELINLKNI